MELHLLINGKWFLMVWFVWATCFVISFILVFIQYKLDEDTYDDLNDIKWTRIYLLGPSAILILLLGIIITIIVNHFVK